MEVHELASHYGWSLREIVRCRALRDGRCCARSMTAGRGHDELFRATHTSRTARGTRRGGAALRDPFENVAPSTLDAPVLRPSSAASPAPAQSVIPEVSQPARTVVETRSTILTEHEPQRSETAPGQPVLPPASQAAPVRAAERASAAAETPLGRADAFMRAVGVEAARAETPPRRGLPESIAPPVSARAPSKIPAMPVRDAPMPHEASPESRVKPAALQPPPPRRRETSIPESKPRETRATRAESNTPAASPQAPRQPVRDREVVRERIHVVKVVQGTREAGASVTAGAAAPTFGAAQL